MKTLYEFEAPKKVMQKVETETDEGTLIKEEEVTITVPVALKSPNRREIEEGEMFYATELSKCIKAGIITKTMLAKTYANAGGALSDEEKEIYKDLYERFTQKQFEYQLLSSKISIGEVDAKEAGDRLVRVSEEFWDLYQQLQEFENEQAQLFNQTAENIARNKTLLWLTTQLTYYKPPAEVGEELSRKWVQFFEGESFDDKLDYYDDILEKEDVFRRDIVDKMSIIVAFWYTGRASTPEEFEYLFEVLQKTGEEEDEGQPEESEKQEEPAAV